jgi:hypothetical protein
MRWARERRLALALCILLSTAASVLALARADEPWRTSIGGLDYRITLLEDKVAVIEAREIWILIALVSNMGAFIIAIGKEAFLKKTVVTPQWKDD